MPEQLGNLPATHEELRSILLDVLRQSPATSLSIAGHGVASIAVKSGLADNSRGNQARAGGFPAHLLSEEDAARVIDIVWDLIIEGIVRPGNKGQEQNLPQFHVTEHGNEMLKNGPSTPYDPDRYLARIRGLVGTIDPIIQTYLVESLHTFRIGCLLSSTVTLGCASEQALLLAIEAYVQALGPTKAVAFKKKLDGQPISRQFEAFRLAIESLTTMSRELKDGLKMALLFVFESIRQNRNDAGHPNDSLVNRETIYAHLAVFPTYLGKMHDLTKWLLGLPPGTVA